MKAQKKFPTPITPKDLNIGVESQFNTSLEMLKILQSFKFISHKINPSEPGIIINECDKIYCHPNKQGEFHHKYQNELKLMTL